MVWLKKSEGLSFTRVSPHPAIKVTATRTGWSNSENLLLCPRPWTALALSSKSLSTTVFRCHLCSTCDTGVSCSEWCPPDQLPGCRGPHGHGSRTRAMHAVAGMPHAEPTALQPCTRLHEKVCVFAPPIFIIFFSSSSHVQFLLFFS